MSFALSMLTTLISPRALIDVFAGHMDSACGHGLCHHNESRARSRIRVCSRLGRRWGRRSHHSLPMDGSLSSAEANPTKGVESPPPLSPSPPCTLMQTELRANMLHNREFSAPTTLQSRLQCASWVQCSSKLWLLASRTSSAIHSSVSPPCKLTALGQCKSLPTRFSARCAPSTALILVLRGSSAIHRPRAFQKKIMHILHRIIADMDVFDYCLRCRQHRNTNARGRGSQHRQHREGESSHRAAAGYERIRRRIFRVRLVSV